MSSVTISMTLWCCSASGEWIRSFNSPGTRCRASSRCARAASSISSAVNPISSSSGANRQNLPTRVAASWSSPASDTAWATSRSALGTGSSNSASSASSASASGGSPRS